MQSQLLTDMLQLLDAPQGHYALLSQYASNTQPLAFISPESRKMLGNRMSRMSVNIARLAVTSMVERLRVNGFSDDRAWQLYVDNDLDQRIADAFFDALLYGEAFVLVWAKNGKATASIESPRECAVLRDPADHSVVLAGVKRFSTKTESHAYLYLPDRIEHWVGPHTGPAKSGYTVREVIEHDLGVCPLVPIENGRSEVADLLPLIDALSKLLLDMMIASEAAGKPRRWISGLELIEEPRLDDDGNPVLDDQGEPIVDVKNPIDDVNTIQTMIAESKDTKFGQLDATGLGGFKDGVQVIISQIQAISSLPSHYLSALSATIAPSADGLRSSEAALTARCEQKQLLFGRAMEMVAKLLIAVDTGTPVEDISLRVSFAPADTRSVAQETDAVVKLVTANILPVSYALKKLGYSDDEIERIRAAKRSESLDSQGVALLPTRTPNAPENEPEAA